MEKKSVISFENVSFFYHQNLILDQITFTIHAGDYVGVLGPNGGGKTTLLKMILGLEKPNTGTITLFEKKPTRSLYQRIGYVPQTAAQKDWHFPATVEEVVASGRTSQKNGRFSSRENKKAITDALETLELLPLRKKLIEELSGGQRQRVFIARALCGSPDVLILDEPTVGVDAPSQEQFYRFIKKLNKEKKITILFVTHDIDVVAKEAKAILCLNRTLLCHVPAKDGITPTILKKMYGVQGEHLTHLHE